MKGVQIRSYFCSIFSYIRTEYGKIRARKNAVFGHFSRNVVYYASQPKEVMKSLVDKIDVIGFFAVMWLVLITFVGAEKGRYIFLLPIFLCFVYMLCLVLSLVSVLI